MKRARVGLLLGLFAALGAGAAKPDRFTLIELHSGVNELDLDGDGTKDVIVKAWRENGNAHGFTNYAFYRLTPTGEWNVMTLETKKHSEVGFNTTEGADCRLGDLRLYRTAHGRLQLVTAERALGEGYTDSRPVTFSTWAVKRNDEGIPGWPEVYFEMTGSKTTKTRYCDVGEAFEREYPE